MNAQEALSDLRGRFFRYRIGFGTEADLQTGIEFVLRTEELEFAREFRLSPNERPDFWLPGPGIAIEAKVEGSTIQVARQLRRYCVFPEVRGVLLVTSRVAHRAIPPVLGDKPVEVWCPAYTALR